MPNTPVRAAAEGMPDVTRRNALVTTGAGLMAALVGSLAVTPAKANAAPAIVPQELPVDRVNRIAWELADALNTYADGRFHAEIYPSLPHDYPVIMVHTKAREQGKTLVSMQFRELVAAYDAAEKALVAAMRKTDDVVLGREPSKAALKRLDKVSRAETRALMAVCSYRPWNDGERKEKARVMLGYERGGRLDDSHFRAILAASA